jgi:hypothetical protein
MSILWSLPGPNKNFVKINCRPSSADLYTTWQNTYKPTPVFVAVEGIPYAYLGEVLRLASRRRKPAFKGGAIKDEDLRPRFVAQDSL